MTVLSVEGLCKDFRLRQGLRTRTLSAGSLESVQCVILFESG